MSNHLKESDLQSIAKQLSNPTGVEGIQMGEIMNESNAGMITSTIKTLNLVDNQSILELGHGNCSHLADILNSAKNLEYAGLEISDTMHQQASEKNSPFLSEKIRFELYDGIKIPFKESYFDKIFSVNTVYFWQKPLDLLNEIYRVLKSDGKLLLTFAHKSFMEELPFTKYGFQLYEPGDLTALAKQANFKVDVIQTLEETLRNKGGDTMNRTYSVLCLKKAKQ